LAKIDVTVGNSNKPQVFAASLGSDNVKNDIMANGLMLD
jgi:hypothetical protein